MKRFSSLWLLALLLLGGQARPTRAHTSQVEPVVAAIRPQTSFLTVDLTGNGEDIVQAVQVRDSERIGNTEFTPAVTGRWQGYLNTHLQLS